MPTAPEPPPVVLIEGLTKRLRGVLAVDGLDLTVERGQVVGLAGPNGAGKSVTLKILLGLVRPTSGRVELFGEPARPGAPALARVGALVDGPGFVPHLSGRVNLRLACRLAHLGDAELERAVANARLGPAIDRQYRTYSHGMRYRLGLAQALLGQPELLILDEPTTGLDPAHIREIRHAIADAAAAGATVLFSSHVLREVEQVCTHAVVMQQGRLVGAGRVEDLVHMTDTVRLETDRPDDAAEVLRATDGITSVLVDDGAVEAQGPALRPGDLLLKLDAAGLAVQGFRRGRSLEEAYLELVGETAAESGPPEASPGP
ncbi:MAG TPA: ATP-binding cassette domain-containing protein [Acidimicrobiales bacterium]|nr:ATP-binding cassette domain-containing protein [Acidimicrobiales bacterium]